MNLNQLIYNIKMVTHLQLGNFSNNCMRECNKKRDALGALCHSLLFNLTEIINKSIDVVLLILVTGNAFFHFIPDKITIVLELSILCKLFYTHLPGITKKLYETQYGVFTEKRWVRLGIIIFLIPSFFAENASSVKTFIFIFLLMFSIMCLILSQSWEDYTKDISPEHQLFWMVFSRGLNKNLADEWKIYEENPNMFSTFIWYSGPGVALGILSTVFYCIFAIISLYSKLFTLIFIIWLLVNIITLFNLKFKNPNIDLYLITSISSIDLSLKSTFGLMTIVVGFGSLLKFLFSKLDIFIFFDLPYLQNHLSLIFKYLVLDLPPYIFIFFFWYILLKRYPYFLKSEHNEKSRFFSKPLYELFGFIISFVCIIYIEIILPKILFYRASFMMNTLINAPILLLNLILITSIPITVASSKKNKLVVTRTDNITIPLAIFSQSVVLFLIAHSEETPLSYKKYLSVVIVSLVLIILFFFEDFNSYLKCKCGDNTITYIIGEYFPIIIGCILLNLACYLLSIFYIGLILAAIVFFVIVDDIRMRTSINPDIQTLTHKPYINGFAKMWLNRNIRMLLKYPKKCENLMGHEVNLDNEHIPISRNREKIKRPIAIKIAAIMFGIFGTIELVSGLIIITFGHVTEYIFLNEGVRFVGVFMLIDGILDIIVGNGLWELKKWSGILGIILGIIGLIMNSVIIAVDMISTFLSLTSLILILFGWNKLK